MKQTVINLLPPLCVVAVVLFWGLWPEASPDGGWCLLVGTVTTAAIQGLELCCERHEGWRINRREFLTDAGYLALASCAMPWLTTHLADEPLIAAKNALGLHTEWAMDLPFLAQVALVMIVSELGQYGLHRWMHNSKPLWLIHAPHHHLTQLNAMKAAVGHPIELFLIGLSLVAIFDIPLTALFCAINIAGVTSTFAHANVSANPPRWYAAVFTTIRHHSLHHSVAYDDTRCNYANTLILLDRLFGTFRDGEVSVVGQEDRRRLSIREQWLFPFAPWIDGRRARRAASVLMSHEARKG